MRGWLAACLVLMLGAGAAHAQTPQQVEFYKTCLNDEGKAMLDDAIAACTALINDSTVDKSAQMDSLFSRSNAYARKGNHQGAIADFTAVFENDPTDGDAVANRGNAYQYGLHDYDKALADYDKALAIRADALDFFNRGSAFLDGRRDYARAISDFGKSIELDANVPRYYAARCWARAVWGQDLQLSLNDCSWGLQMKDVGDAQLPLLQGRGIANYKLGKYAEARADFDRALAGQPNDAELTYGRGLSDLKLGKAGADGDIGKAKMANPDVAEIFKGYGISP